MSALQLGDTNVGANYYYYYYILKKKSPFTMKYKNNYVETFFTVKYLTLITIKDIYIKEDIYFQN